MALKPTIYKTHIDLSDMDREVYNSFNLTLAQHPSETIERMMVRVIAYCLNAHDGLQFTKGLSTPDEPDIWLKANDGLMTLWIDVGEPLPERIKKATRVATSVKIYTFNSKSDVWWNQNKKDFSALDVDVWQLQWGEVKKLAEMVERTMDFAVTVTERTIYISSKNHQVSLALVKLL
ncbi:YaeQ family protein [Aurantivibrio plasticivorans]